jgi:hypothetical protein
MLTVMTLSFAIARGSQLPYHTADNPVAERGTSFMLAHAQRDTQPMLAKPRHSYRHDQAPRPMQQRCLERWPSSWDQTFRGYRVTQIDGQCLKAAGFRQLASGLQPACESPSVQERPAFAG